MICSGVRNWTGPTGTDPEEFRKFSEDALGQGCGDGWDAKQRSA